MNASVCGLCRNGELREGTATVTIEKGGAVVVIRDVLALVCDSCDDYYVSEEITRRLLAEARAAATRGTEVEIIRFAA